LVLQEKSSLTSDYDRKYAELTRTLEHRAKLDEQLAKLSQQLSDISDVTQYYLLIQ
jgi:phage shock protein A